MAGAPRNVEWLKLHEVPPHLIALGAVGAAGAATTRWETLIQELTRPLPAALLACLGVAGAAHAWSRYQQAKSLPVAVLTYSFDRRQFRSELVAALVAELGNRDMPVVLKTLDGHDAAHQQVEQLSVVASRRARFRGAIVVPPCAEIPGAELSRLVTTFGRPLVFVDIEPYQTETEYPANAAFVGIDNRAGGERAAEALASALPRGRGANVLVVASPLQRPRQIGFRERFDQLVPGATVRVTEDGGMDRGDAFRVVREWLETADRENFAIDGIVTTNDEMAIGAVQALGRSRRETGKRTVVVGFDGIPEAIEMIESHETPFINTVVQATDLLVSRAAATLTLLIDGIDVTRFFRIEPHLYRPVATPMRPVQ